MRLTLESYWPLLLLVVIPYLWWARRDTVVGLTPKHMELSTMVRAAVVCLLALALMQPVLHIATDATSVVYLVDISQSVAPGSIQSALEWIRTTADAGRANHTQFIAFG